MTKEEEIIQQSIKNYPRFAERRVGFIDGAMWADDNPLQVYIVLRCEGHDDYIEKVFVDRDKAIAYCNQYEGNPNEYGRYFEEMEITL